MKNYLFALFALPFCLNAGTGTEIWSVTTDVSKGTEVRQQDVVEAPASYNLVQEFGATQNAVLQIGRDSSPGRWGGSGYFTAAKSYSLRKVSVYLLKTGTTSASKLSCSIYSNGGTSLPNTELAQASEIMDVNTLSGSFAWVDFTFSGVSLNNGTAYHVVIWADSIEVNYCQWGTQSTGSLRTCSTTTEKASPTWAAADTSAEACMKLYE